MNGQMERLLPQSPPLPSPMVLADRLITLAQEADRAGYAGTAHHLVKLACSVFDERPHPGKAMAQPAPAMVLR